jgi:uncharacterized protein
MRANCLKYLWPVLVFVALQSAGAIDYPSRAAPFSSVRLSPVFWASRLETNRTVTIAHNLREVEKQGSLGGFAILAGVSKEKYHGYMWGDSDVTKTLEGVAYSLMNHPDAELEKRMESIVATIAGAQAPDGYLMPHLQIAEPRYLHFKDEATRTCELFDMGHLIESAVAHYEATGRRNYLDTAIRLADLIVRTYGPGGLDKPSGHPEIELALVRLYRATGQRAYLELAAAFVERARRSVTAWTQGKPALGHDEALGHAVAMTYLYCGATDVAELTGDKALLGLMERKWESVVGRKLYLTGTAGNRAKGENFSADYDLPNATAYCETCAAIANILWNQRMFLAHGDAKYIDVLERTLYNGFLSGAGMSGDRYFYPNPLQWDGKQKFNRGHTERFAWTDCPCCPANIVRFMPTIPGYAYATQGETLFVNLFMAGAATLRVGGLSVEVVQQTRYPWDGRVRIAINPEKSAQFSLAIRIPGWARNMPVPSDLYGYTEKRSEPVELGVNNQPVGNDMTQGYIRLRRQWRQGDMVELSLPMPVRRVVAHAAVKEDAGKVAVERGPIVYCAEGVDNGGKVLAAALGDECRFSAEHKPDLLGGVTVVRAESDSSSLTLVPYHAWNYRGPGEMAVWLKRGTRE